MEVKVWDFDEVVTNTRRMMSAGSGAGLMESADDDLGNLAGMLKDAKAVPSTTSIVAVPVAPSSPGSAPAGPSQADLASLADVELLETYVSVASMAMLYKQKPAGWDISDPTQAADFIKQSASAKYRVFTEGLSGVCPIETNVAAKLSKETTSADIHTDFLDGIFSSFNFSSASMKELDGVLTNVANALRDVKVSWSDQSQTVDHLLSVYFFEPVQGLEGVHVPKLRLFYMHIDQRTWTLAIGKSSVEHFEFNMNFNDAIGALNANQMNRDRDALQAFVDKVDAQNQGEITKLTSPKVVHDTTADQRGGGAAPS